MSQPRSNALGQPIGEALEGDFPRPRPPRTAMTGRFCTVAPADPGAEAEALHRAFAEDAEGRDWTYLAQDPFDSAEAFAAWLSEACAVEDPFFHTIRDAQGAPSGLASFMRIDPAAGVLEIGNIHFAPRLQRRPAGTEALFLMMRRAFDELGYRRCEWKCDSLNAPSRRAAERLGFSYEGLFRQATHYKGRNRDTAWYALIDRDWPRVRAAFEAWLSPDNFDAQGRQIRSLQARLPG